MRGFWTAELQRQQTAMMNEASREIMRFWTEAWGLPAPPQRREEAPLTYAFRRDISERAFVCRKQLVRWSSTMPVACMKA
jgi:hypothetical protein